MFQLTALKNYIIAKSIIEVLKSNNFEAYIVGGAVRDLLMGFTPKDFDISTSAKIEDLEKLFPYNANEKFKSFLIYSFKIENFTIEISCFRDESKIKNRNSLPVYGNIKTDYLRRDFTVNALYLDPTTNEIKDFSTGLADVKTKTLRPVRDPDILFAEDMVRVIRAIKFQRKFNMDFSFDIDKYIKEVDWTDGRVKQEVKSVQKINRLF